MVCLGYDVLKAPKCVLADSTAVVYACRQGAIHCYPLLSTAVVYVFRQGATVPLR